MPFCAQCGTLSESRREVLFGLRAAARRCPTNAGRPVGEGDGLRAARSIGVRAGDHGYGDVLRAVSKRA